MRNNLIQYLINTIVLCMMPVAAIAFFVITATIASDLGINNPAPATSCVYTTRGNIVCGDAVP